jgi:sorbose reductase
MFDLKGKNFVITGGGRGIGYAATRAIAEMGGNVAVMDVLSKPVGDFEQLSAEFGVKSLYINANMTKEDDLNSAFEQTAIELGSIDGW